MNYDYDNVKTLTMPEDTWCFPSSLVIMSLSSSFFDFISKEPAVLSLMLDEFGCHIFSLQRPSLPFNPLRNDYIRKKQLFLKLKIIPLSLALWI